MRHGAARHARPRPRRRRRDLGRRIAVQLGLIALFALPAVVLWWHAWSGHLASTLACSCGDSGQQVWFVAWPAYAISHGLNPFLSHAVSAPQGANLLASTSSLAVGTALAPVTWLSGPVVATTVALTLAPALSAWGCYVACRRFTVWRPAAVAAALLFGYSPFVVDNVATGHLQLGLLVVPPLALVVGHELAVTQRGPAWRWGLALGALVFVQFLISSEVLAMMAVLAIVAVPLWAALTYRTVPAKLPYLVRGGVWAAVSGTVLTAWPAWYSLEGPRHVVGAPWSVTQAAGIVLSDFWSPGDYHQPALFLTRIGGYEGLQGPSATYLGSLVLVLVGTALFVAFQRRLTWFLAVMTAAAVLLALGIFGWTTGSHVLPVGWLPWDSLGKLPILERIGPQRFVVAIDLFAAMLAAVGLDAAWHRWAHPLGARHRRGRPLTWLTVLVLLVVAAVGGVASIWRTYQVPFHTQRVQVPAWYVSAERTLPQGSVVLAYPFPMSATGMSQSMVWQAVTGMRFTLAGGYLKLPGKDGRPLSTGEPDSAYRTLGALSQKAVGPLPTATPQRIAGLRAAITEWHVDDVVVADRGEAPVYAAAFLTAALGQAPVVSHGAWTWDLDAQGDPAPPTTTAAAAAAAAAVRTCVPVPAYGRAPESQPLPVAADRCVAGYLTQTAG